MKSTKQSNNLKSRTLSVVICAILILCALFSFGLSSLLLTTDRLAVADESERAKNGPRFVQVAAGEDFAIGLTADGDLYGWSLLDESDSNKGTSATTLGEYYTVTPTQIPVYFVMGPGQSETAQAADKNAYYSKSNDSIKKIVATRTTAAFLTDAGYIYTWGKDDHSIENVFISDQNAKPRYLLLRIPDNALPADYYGRSSSLPWYRPDIIDYNYYTYGGSVDAMNYMRKISGQSFSDFDIAAGEYNYVLTATATYKAGGDSHVYAFSYVWGSLMYSTVNTVQAHSSTKYTYDTSNDLEGGVQKRKAIALKTIGGGDDTVMLNAVAGGYNVGYLLGAASSSLSLKLRGRNFLTSQYNSGVIKTLNSSATSDIAYTQADTTGSPFTIAGGILGGQGITSTGTVEVSGVDLAKYYGDVPTVNFANTRTVAVKNAHGQEVATEEVSGTTVIKYGAEQFGVSLGNDVGYGLTPLVGSGSTATGGKLYVWGDNTYGQLGNDPAAGNYYKQTPDELIVSGAGRFVSVAAGKQLSANEKAFHNYLDDNKTIIGVTFATGEGGSVTGFSDAVKNDRKFITGAVDENGKLFVWSNADGKHTPEPLVYGGGTAVADGNKYIAVYSGYGNNLFAVTEIGKLVRVYLDGTTYVQHYYDKFVKLNESGAAVAVENWAVDSTNYIEFAPSVSSSKEKIDPHLGSATLYVWDTTEVKHDPEATEPDTNGNVTYKHGSSQNIDGFTPFVSKNDIGDVYRILGVKTTDNKYTGDDAKRFISPEFEKERDISFAPKFSYKPSASAEPVYMTDKQQQNMFDFEVVHDANGLGIKITPNQSSRGYTITVEFYIARYSYAANFTDASSDFDKAVYYDYKKCRFDFKVADTPTVCVYNAYDSKNGGKSNIPLLDPNNEYNKFYSIAVQNVTEGIDKLLTHLNVNKNTVVERLTGGVNKTVWDKLLEKLDDADDGFPASSKIDAGDLEYYLGSDAAAKYNNEYQWVFSDRDADRIVADNRYAELITGQYIDAVKGKIRDITVNDLDTGIVLTDIADGKTAVQQLDDLRKKLVAEFDNTYGLFDIKLVLGEGGKLLLSFSYQVMQFEGTGTTGTIIYTDSTVSSYNTIYEASHASANIKLTTYYGDYSVGYGENDKFDGNFGKVSVAVPTMNGNDGLVAVYSAPTLRVNKGVSGNNIYTGNHDSEVYDNHFEVTYADPIVVGESVTVKLSDYFKNINGNIQFTYENSVDPEKFAEFNKQFVDQTGYGKQPVVLSGTTLTVTPTTTLPIHLTLTMQRFANATNTKPFEAENSTAENRIYDEKITVDFVFGNIRDFTFSRVDVNNPDSDPHLITKSETFHILGRGENPSIYNATSFVTVGGANLTNASIERLRNLVRISNITTSEDTKAADKRFFSVIPSDDKKSFTVNPLSSGSGSVRFVATLYNKSIVFSVKLNIAAKTLVNDVITVVDDQRLYVESIKNELEKANSVDNEPYFEIDDYRIITDDVKGAVYFTLNPGEGIDMAQGPAFIDSIAFEGVGTSDPNIRVRASTSTKDSTSTTYYMHVRFTSDKNAEKYEDLPAGTIIEAVYPIMSGKVRIATDIHIDVRNPHNGQIEGTKINMSSQGMGLETVVTVTAKDLLDQLGREGSDEYTIVIIKSDTETTKYFSYAKVQNDKAISITPINNTPNGESRELEVAVTRTANNVTTYMMITFTVSVDGILTVLPVMSDENSIGYGNIWIYSALIVFGVLAIIFIVRLIIYFKKRAQQRAIIKRNQELIRMRDRMHNKGATATREQMVKTRLKMDDPKYAKMFREMKKSRTEENGGLVVDDDIGAATAIPGNDKKKKKKKGGKKTVAELKAELEAKKAAFAAAQAQSAQPVNPFANDVPVGGAPFDAVDAEFVNPDGDFVQPDAGGFDAQPIDGGEIVFDATDFGDGE